MEFVTFEGLGGSGGGVDRRSFPMVTFEGIGDERPETSWSSTAKRATIAGAAVLGGIVLIAILSRANVCPKLQRKYTDNWLNHGYGLAEWTKREAAAKGCRWALEKPVDVMLDQE